MYCLLFTDTYTLEKFLQVKLARCIPIYSPLRNATSGSREDVYSFIFTQWLKLHTSLLPVWTNSWSIILLQKQVKGARVPYHFWGVHGQIDDQLCLIKAGDCCSEPQQWVCRWRACSVQIAKGHGDILPKAHSNLDLNPGLNYLVNHLITICIS